MTQGQHRPPHSPTATTGATAAAVDPTRRAVLRGVGLIGFGAGLGLLSACGVAAEQADGSEGAADGSSPATGGTLTLAVDGTSAVIDPAFYTTLGDWMAVDCICRGLTFIDFETNDPQPDLAESWTISDDGLTYTFALRQGVTFHDGTAFTSADVLASLGRQFDAEDPTLPEGSSRPLRSLGANVASLTAPDPATVVMVLTAADRTVLGRLSDIGGRIISSAALTAAGADIGKALVGTGPFRFSSATAGQSVVLEAFEDYYPGRPLVDRLVLQQVQDSSTIVSGLLSGDISATQFAPYSSIEQLQGDDSVTVHDSPDGFCAIMMLDARRPALAELEVRKAVSLAIDRETLIAQAFFGFGALPEGFAIPPEQSGYDTSLADLTTYDPAGATALLESVGAVGRTVHLMAASDAWHPRAAQIIEQNLTDVGFVVMTDSVDPATYFSRLLDPEDEFHDLMIWERNSYVPDPSDMVGAMAAPSGVYGDFTTGFATLPGASEFADLLFAAKNIEDGPERTAAYTAIQRRWAEDYATMTVLNYSTNVVVSGADVEGLNTDALSNHRCYVEDASV